MPDKKRPALRIGDLKEEKIKVRKLKKYMRTYSKRLSDRHAVVDKLHVKVSATKKKLSNAEDKLTKRDHLTNGRIIQSNFSYYYAMVGYSVTEAFLRENNLTKRMGSSLIIISQYSIIKFSEVRNWMPIGSARGLKALESRGLIQKVNVQGALLKTRRGWVVTPLGRELIDKYQAYFDEFFKKNKNIHIFNSDERVVVKNGRKTIEQIKG